MKIIFVNYSGTCYPEIPIGLLSLATIVKENNFDVEIIDIDMMIKDGTLKLEDTLHRFIKNIAEVIYNSNPDIISFYSICSTYHVIISIAHFIRNARKDIKIVLGGPQATLTANETLEKFEFIDLIGLGEGEETIVGIVKWLLNETIEIPRGCAYRMNSQIVINNNLSLIDVEKMKTLDYSLITLSKYKAIQIDVGRGCPYSCSFCSTKTFWKKKFRLKSTTKIIEEMKYFINTFGIRDFVFVHDLFTANLKKVEEFCNAVIDEDYNINWGCSSRVDTLNSETIKLMKTAGLTHIYLGIETGSQRMQKLINKNLNVSVIPDTINLLLENKINIVASFIYGFPDEEVNDLQETITLINNLLEKGITTQLHLFAPLAGTEHYEYLKNKLFLNRIHSDLGDGIYVDDCKEMIVNNHSIFPHFYNFKNDVRSNFMYLNRFITFFVNGLYKDFRGTFVEMIKCQNNNLLDFYLSFVEYEKLKVGLSTLSEANPNLGYVAIKEMCVDLLRNYIDFIQENVLLKEIFKYERDIFEFRKNRKVLLDTGTYDFNVFEFHNNNCRIFNDALNQKTSVTFKKINGNIKIVRAESS